MTPQPANAPKVRAADPVSPSTGGPWQWADTLAMLAGITFTSPLTRKFANASALGFLGFLCFLGYASPGMHWCFGLSGLFGLFGLIGVAEVLELVARRKAMAARVDDNGGPRFSRLAIVGAAWAPLFFVMAFLAFFAFFARSVHVPAGSQPPRPEWWQWLLMFTVLPLGLLAPFGTTILGAVALAQIRHSAGRLYGLALALFDTVLFPLLLLDGLIGWLWWFVSDLIRQALIANAAGEQLSAATMTFIANQTQIVVWVTILTSLLVDFLIVRWAWRAANKPVGGETAAAPRTDKAMSGRSRWGLVALVLAFAGVVVPLLACQFAPPRYLAITFVVMVDLFLVCEVIGLVLGLYAWKSPAGKATVILSAVSVLVWIAYLARSRADQDILLKPERAAANREPVAIDVVQRSLVTYLASKEQIPHIESFLKTAPAASDYPAAIFDESPGREAYRVRNDVKVFPVRRMEQAATNGVPLGEIYRKDEKTFYLKWIGSDLSTRQFYGPFKGTPESVLGLQKLDLRSSAPAEASFGPVMEREIPFGNACLKIETGELMPLPDLAGAQAVRRVGGSLY